MAEGSLSRRPMAAALLALVSVALLLVVVPSPWGQHAVSLVARTFGPQDVVNVAVDGRLLPVMHQKGNQKHTYDPAGSSRYAPETSLSFARVLYEDFDMTYADNADLSGYVGRDVVQLGSYYAETKFGCITHCSDPHFNGVDGILGLGMPAAAGKTLPKPLFFAITDIFGGHYANNRILRPPKFSIFSNDEGAELQLGGTDPDCLATDMIYMKTTSVAEYSLEVEALSFGGIELLEFTKPSEHAALPAILDSGTSCLVLPNSTFGGVLRDNPYEKFKQVERKDISFYITVQGHIFEIPFRHWWRDAINAACVQPSPGNYNGLLLGDVVFRSLVVEFDLTHPKHPVIGLAPPNPDYIPVKPGESGPAHRVPMIKHSGTGGITFEHPHRHHKGIDRLPVMIDVAETVYFVNVSIGTPRQLFTVFMDTGSSVFAVFAKKPPPTANIHLPSGELSLPKRIKQETMRASIESRLKRLVHPGGGAHSHAHAAHARHRKQSNPIKFLQTGAEDLGRSASAPPAVLLLLLACVAAFVLALATYRRRRVSHTELAE